MQRLAAEDGSVCKYADTFPFMEHTTDDVFLSFRSHTDKRFVYDATRMRLFSIFRVSGLFNCPKCL